MEKINYSSFYGNFDKKLNNNYKLKIGNILVVKNDFRYFDIVKVIDIYTSESSNKFIIANKSLIAKNELTYLKDISEILGIVLLNEGVIKNDFNKF